MLHPSPVGGFGELFPSPAKGHQENPGLSDEQGAEAQALVNAALGGYYTRAEVASLLAGKEPSIGSLPQANVAGLIADLAGKASASALAAVNANLTQSIVTSQTTLEQQIDTKASTSQLTQAVATRHTLISAEAPLSCQT